MTADDPTVLLVAAGALDIEDEEVLARLAALVREDDPVPVDLVDRIGLALTIEALEAEIGHLERDAEPLLAVRAEEPSIAADTITFTTDVLTVMISVRAQGARVRIDGWLTPPEKLVVEVHHGAQTVATESDDDGRFAFVDLARGSARLLLRRTGDPAVPIVTPQIEL